MHPSRELRRVAGKLHDMHIAMEEILRENEAERRRQQQQHVVIDRKRGFEIPSNLDKYPKSARESQEKDEHECERVRAEASVACQRISKRYDRLVKFITSCPHGNYEEFIDFLIMGGGRTETDVGEQFQEDYNHLLNENFYDVNCDYRKLWNDNLSLGLPAMISTRGGRKFVPAEVVRKKSLTLADSGNWQLSDERVRNFGQSIHNQITQTDKVKIKQGLRLAVGGVSKALREFQFSERLIAVNMDDSEHCSNNDELEEDEREAAELTRLKRDAIETCLNATSEHLLKFVKENPDATYQQWIEDIHPENAHDGALLEGLGKTIDHRFFVEVSDHRRIWNENLLTFLDPHSSKGRVFVPARARHIDDNGESVVAPDILSG